MKTNYNAKITEIESKWPSITGLATASALNAIENKIPNVIDLVKKTDYNAKILDIEKKYFTTSDYNKFMSGILDANIKEKQLVNKSDISGLVNNTDWNKKITILATKAELKAEQDKTKKL